MKETSILNRCKHLYAFNGFMENYNKEDEVFILNLYKYTDADEFNKEFWEEKIKESLKNEHRLLAIALHPKFPTDELFDLLCKKHPKKILKALCTSILTTDVEHRKLDKQLIITCFSQLTEKDLNQMYKDNRGKILQDAIDYDIERYLKKIDLYGYT